MKLNKTFVSADPKYMKYRMSQSNANKVKLLFYIYTPQVYVMLRTTAIYS